MILFSFANKASELAVVDASDKQSKAELIRIANEAIQTGLASLSYESNKTDLEDFSDRTDKSQLDRELVYKFKLFGGNSVAIEQLDCFLQSYQNKTFKNNKSIKNKKYIAIQDLTKEGNQYRFFILDLVKNEVHVFPSSHGRGKGRSSNRKLYSEHVSNKFGSQLTPTGMFLTGKTYYNKRKKWRQGIRLFGLEKGRNEKSFDRGIVIHPGVSRSGDYVSNSFVSSEKDHLVRKSPMYSGMSYGCTALPPKHWKQIKKYLLPGTVFFVFDEELNELGSEYCGENIQTTD